MQKIVVCEQSLYLNEAGIQHWFAYQNLPCFKKTDIFYGSVFDFYCSNEDHLNQFMGLYNDGISTNDDLLKYGIVEPHSIPRDNEYLVRLVEEMGTACQEGGEGSGIRVIEIPDDVKWVLSETDHGTEYIEEVHRWWGYFSQSD